MSTDLNTSLSIRNVAIRDAVVPVVKGQSFFTSLQALGVSSFELQIQRDGSLPAIVLEDGSTPFSLANIDKLAEYLHKQGISVCALLLNTDFSGPSAQWDIDWSVAGIEAAQALGASAVRLDPATVQAVSTEVMHENLIRCLTEVLERTSDTTVTIGLENHGIIANSPEFLDSLFDAVDDNRLGLTLDTGNFYWWGLPLTQLYEVIEHFAPRARHTHIKSINYPADLREQQRPIGYEYGRYASSIDQGDIDIARVIGILQFALYKGALCIENETVSPLPPEDITRILCAEVRTLVNAVNP